MLTSTTCRTTFEPVMGVGGSRALRPLDILLQRERNIEYGGPLAHTIISEVGHIIVIKSSFG